MRIDSSAIILIVMLAAILGAIIYINVTSAFGSPAYALTNNTNMVSPTAGETNQSTNTTTSSTSASVTMQNLAFTPSEVHISVGGTVTWTNMDNVMHTVTSDSGNELNSAMLNPGQSYSHTFMQAGNYTYHCSIHPFMHGTVVIG